MKIGGSSVPRSYQMLDGTEAYQIGEVTEEQDLGVVFINDLKFDNHIYYNLVIKKANSILRLGPSNVLYYVDHI